MEPIQQGTIIFQIIKTLLSKTSNAKRSTIRYLGPSEQNICKIFAKYLQNICRQSTVYNPGCCNFLQVQDPCHFLRVRIQIILIFAQSNCLMFAFISEKQLFNIVSLKFIKNDVGIRNHDFYGAGSVQKIWNEPDPATPAL